MSVSLTYDVTIAEHLRIHHRNANASLLSTALLIRADWPVLEPIFQYRRHFRYTLEPRSWLLPLSLES